MKKTLTMGRQAEGSVMTGQEKDCSLGGTEKCLTCGGEHSRMAPTTAGGFYANGRFFRNYGIAGMMFTKVTCPDCDAPSSPENVEEP